jgi:hypothetical protein
MDLKISIWPFGLKSVLTKFQVHRVKTEEDRLCFSTLLLKVMTYCRLGSLLKKNAQRRAVLAE